MNLLDMFRKSKKAAKPHYLGRMWVCVVKCQPWSNDGQRYAVVIKNVDVVEAYMRDDETRVVSDENNPFNKCNCIRLAGPVGHLEYVQPSYIWIGFFETEDEAQDGYHQFATALVAEIKSASPKRHK